MNDTSELRRLAQAATLGPWEVAYMDQNGQAVIKGEHIEIATCWHHCVGSIEKEMRANAALIAAANPAAITELLDRIDAAEKAVTEAYQRGYATGQEEIEKERDALRAKVEQMGRQRPVRLVFRSDELDEQIRRATDPAWEEKIEVPEGMVALYALPGAQPAPSVPEVTDAMALAFHHALTDGSIGAQEVEEIKDALRAALAAAPEAKP